MFVVNDLVVHGQNGVFRIVSKGKLNIACVDKEKEYYTLQSIYKEGMIAYVPVYNADNVMRLVISEKEAKKIIADIPKLREKGKVLRL